MKVRRVFAQVVATAALASCGSDPVPYRPLFSLADTVSRVKSAAVFDTLWAFGGPDDTLLALPAMPRPDGSGGVVFVDVQSMKVHRIGGEGTLLWSWGRKGEGPGEIKNVRAMDVRDDGSVVLVDSGNRRIVTLDSGGKQIGETGFFGRTVHSVASLLEDKLAVHSTSPLWGVLEGGEVQEAEPPPGTSPSSSVLQHQGHVVRWREDKWVFGYGVGNGWMVFADDALVGVHPYVEHMEVPAVGEADRVRRTSGFVSRPVTSGRSLAVIGDTLHVLFGGLKGLAGYKIDRYNLRTGEYLNTDLLPHHANRAAMAEGRVVTVYSAGLFPRIVALARRSSDDVEAGVSLDKGVER